MSKPLGTMGTLREAFTLPCRNKKLMLPVILLTFIPCSLLMIANYFIIQPLIANLLLSLLMIDPNSPQFTDLLMAIKRDITALLDTNLIVFVVSFVLSSLTLMVVVWATAMTYYRQQPTAHELWVRMRGTWKGPFVTSICVQLLNMGYAAFSIWLTTVLMLNADGIVGAIVIALVVLVALGLFSLYLSMLWTVGLVVAVIEEDCYGFGALGKGGEMLKGRRVQGFAIFCILIAAYVILCIGVYGVGFAIGGVWSQTVAPLVVSNLILVLSISVDMVFTVFYLECKKKDGMKGQASGYLKVPLTVVGDECLP